MQWLIKVTLTGFIILLLAGICLFLDWVLAPIGQSGKIWGLVAQIWKKGIA